MDGGLLQKQSKQVINMTMGMRTEVSNKDAGEEGGGWGRGRCGGVWERSCVLWRVAVVVKGGGDGGRDTKVGKKLKARSREQKGLMSCEIFSELNRAR